eukprot:scaffold1287_cov253-Ochromonas_danica.AAC.20
MKLERLLEDIKDGKNPTHVDLSNEGLSEFPTELFTIAKSIEVLNLGGNHLSHLPEEILQFTELKILFFGQNDFSHIPSQLGQLPKLRMLSFKANHVQTVSESCLSTNLEWLILTDNNISELPQSIGKLVKLRKLLLAGNQLSSLPESMKNCRELELVRLSSNRLSVLPPWLLRLPKLSWIAFAGNQINYSPRPSDLRVPSIRWQDLEIQNKLGEGASALKEFKGEVTSDGLAEDEILVSENVGNHPTFIKVLGRVVDHPAGLPGLLLPLLPLDRFSILGGPPSFQSITRDTFNPDHPNYPLSYVIDVLTSVAAGCEHLRSLSVMHGDLYAHNILTTSPLASSSPTEALLTDFGASSFYPVDEEQQQYLERVEVRAFGCLMEDLLTRLQKESSRDQKTEDELKELMQKCLDEDVLKRPTFEILNRALLSYRSDV